jgi:hypothetical protein
MASVYPSGTDKSSIHAIEPQVLNGATNHLEMIVEHYRMQKEFVKRRTEL